MPIDLFQKYTTGAGRYIWAVVILVLIGAVIVLGILWLRPDSDPLVVFGKVMEGLAPTIAGVMAYLKSQETHLSVNSRLDAFILQSSKAAHAEGVIAGTAAERLNAQDLKQAVIDMQPIPVVSIEGK